MTTVFVNYRTKDEENVAALLEHALSKRFQSGVFFRASKSIRAGADWRRELIRGVRTSSALLAVIGERWLEVPGDDGARKIDNEADWVRRELAEAFRLDIPVVPVLVGKAMPPEEENLPDELKPLARCQCVRLRNRDLETDLDRIAVELTKLIPDLHDEKVVPPAAGPVTNNTISGNANVGFQAGTIHGNVDFGGFKNRNDR
jgi:hypothetical protein